MLIQKTQGVLQRRSHGLNKVCCYILLYSAFAFFCADPWPMPYLIFLWPHYLYLLPLVVSKADGETTKDANQERLARMSRLAEMEDLQAPQNFPLAPLSIKVRLFQ